MDGCDHLKLEISLYKATTDLKSRQVKIDFASTSIVSAVERDSLFMKMTFKLILLLVKGMVVFSQTTNFPTHPTAPEFPKIGCPMVLKRYNFERFNSFVGSSKTMSWRCPGILTTASQRPVVFQTS